MRARRGHAIVSIIAAALLMAASAGADASRLAGDINCDGLADCNDVNPFLSLMGLPCSGTLPSGCPCANADCNGDGWITFADLACFLVTLDCSDCNGNLIDDAADIANCTGQAWCGDCNSNGVPDGCDIDPNDPDGDGLVSSDCNLNGVPDECEILPGDVNLDGVADCNDTNAFVARLNTSCGTCDWACWSADCDGNGLVTWRDIPGFWAATGCPDCNGNGVADPNDIAGGTSLDCNSNGIPDECDINPADPDLDGLVSSDCNSNGVPDECDTAVGTSPDCDTNGIPDECETTPTMLGDCNCDCLADCSDIDYFVAGLNDNVLAWQAHYSGAHGGQLPPCPFAILDC